MSRCIAAIAAIGLATTITARAQETVKSQTKVEGGKSVSFTGCLQSGTEVKTYVLDHVVPVRTTVETKGTAGTTVETKTTYILVPGEKIELQPHVGHKVEVTGVLIPAGADAKIETQTKIEREGARDTKEKEKTKIEGAATSQLRVTSIKHLAESCTM